MIAMAMAMMVTIIHFLFLNVLSQKFRCSITGKAQYENTSNKKE
jgi:hypothetical protein